MMKLLLTIPQGGIKTKYFPDRLLARLHSFGAVTENPHGRQYTREELMELLPTTDIVLTHWGSPQYDEELLSHAPNLKLLAHCAGTVAHIASAGFYTRGIPVLSANAVMARYVAEGTLGYILAGLRGIPAYDQNMRAGGWRQNAPDTASLIGATVGFVGLGTVGRNLLDMLAPFSCRAVVYDPYLPDGALDAWDFAHAGTFDDALSADAVTVHASQTPETYHMINAAALAKMHDDALLVNTARGSLVDSEALIPELQSGRLRAVLDVYETEGIPQDSRLLACTENLILQPHLAGMPSGAYMTEAILDDIERFLSGKPMRLCVGKEQFLHMTQE